MTLQRPDKVRVDDVNGQKRSTWGSVGTKHGSGQQEHLEIKNMFALQEDLGISFHGQK